MQNQKIPIAVIVTILIQTVATIWWLAKLTCRAQVIEKLKYFVSQEAFNITGLGDKQIEFFYNLGLIKQIPDIFTLEKRLNEFNLQEQHGWGEKSLSNLLSSINSRRTISLDKFIYALGIRFVGQHVAKLLANYYTSFDNWYNSMAKLQSQPYLSNINGIGEKITGSIRAFFFDQQSINMLNNLVLHLKILPVDNNKCNSTLNGKIIVFTGELLSISRNEAKAKAESLGAHVSSSVSSKAHFLVVGKSPGSKYKRALELGIRILTEEKWCELANHH